MEAEQNLSPLEILTFIYRNLEDAQKLRGAFTLEDCRAVLIAKRRLQSFLDKGKEEAAEAPEDVVAALGVLRSAADIQQKTGVFTIEGSADLLNGFDALRRILQTLRLHPPVA